MSAISVVRADRSRLPVLLELVAAYYRFDHIDFDRESAERTLGELIDTPALGGAWLALRGDATVGYFVLTLGYDVEFGGRVATMTDLFIIAEVRGQVSAESSWTTPTRPSPGSGSRRSSSRSNARIPPPWSTAHDRIPHSRRVTKRP